MGTKGTYPDWQEHLRKAQDVRNDTLRQQAEAAARRQKEQEKARQEQIDRELKIILGFLGIEAGTNEGQGRWQIDYVVFYDPELAIRTTNTGIQHSWSLRVTTVKENDLLEWYKSEDRDQYTDPWGEDRICQPEWPSVRLGTREYRDAQHNWRSEQADLADALDALDTRVEKVHAQWAADQKTFEERKRRAEERAREERLRQEEEEAAQYEEEAARYEEENHAVPAQATPLSLEERLATTLREFIREATRPPEY